MTTAHERRILKFTALERLVHWGVAISFLILLLTGLVILKYGWFSWLAPLFGGAVTGRTVHRAAAVAFTIFLGIAATFGYQKWTARVFLLDGDDRRFLRRLLPYFLSLESGDHMPPAGMYNGGQKMWSISLVAGGTLIILNGLVMWFGEAFPRWFVQWMFPIHDLLSLCLGSLALGHIYQATLHFETGSSRSAMLDGTLSEEYVRSHHVRWYEELNRGG